MSIPNLIKTIKIRGPDYDSSSKEDKKMPMKEQILQQQEPLRQKEVVLDDEAMATNNRSFTSIRRRKSHRKSQKKSHKQVLTRSLITTSRQLPPHTKTVSLPCDAEMTSIEKTSVVVPSEKGKIRKAQEDTGKGASSFKKNALVTKNATNHEKDREKNTAKTNSEMKKGASSSMKNSSVTKTSINQEKDEGDKTTTPKTRNSTLGNDSLLFKKETSISRNTIRNGTDEEKITEPYKKSTLIKGMSSSKKKESVANATTKHGKAGAKETTRPEITSTQSNGTKMSRETKKAIKPHTGKEQSKRQLDNSIQSKTTFSSQKDKSWTKISQTLEEISTKKNTKGHGTGVAKNLIGTLSKFQNNSILDPLSARYYCLLLYPNYEELVVMPFIPQLGGNSSLDSANYDEEGLSIQELIRRTPPGATPTSIDRIMPVPVFPIQEGITFNENENISFLDDGLVIMPLMQQNLFAGTSTARQHHSINPNEDGFERRREAERERDLIMSLQFGSNSSLDFANYHEDGLTIQQLIRRTTPGARVTPDDGTVSTPVFAIQEGVIFNQAIQDILN